MLSKVRYKPSYMTSISLCGACYVLCIVQASAWPHGRANRQAKVQRTFQRIARFLRTALEKQYPVSRHFEQERLLDSESDCECG
jgi:hypothetical protein